MWTEKTVLRCGSAAATVAALSRMVKPQSWPQLGASTMIRCWNPLLRSRVIAAEVAWVQPGVVALLPKGSLPMLRTT